jgi:hypothetical protein
MSQAEIASESAEQELLPNEMSLQLERRKKPYYKVPRPTCTAFENACDFF